MIDHVPKILPNEPKTKILKREDIKGELRFDNVSFSYPSDKNLKVLKDFSCVFKQGTTTAFVGPSGSGKSTIIQLLERFYDPNEGHISIDDIDIRKCNLSSFRHLIGYVGQEPVLLNTTIEENMKFAKPDATTEEIISALKAANAWSFISSKL